MLMMLIMVVFVLGSCTKEPSTDGELPGEAIYINLSSTDSTQTRNPSAMNYPEEEERRISRASILFYGTVPGVNENSLVKEINVQVEDMMNNRMIVIPASEIDTKQTYRIMVIANGAVSNNQIHDIDDLSNAVAYIGNSYPIIHPLDNRFLLMSNTNRWAWHNFSENPILFVTLSIRMVKLNVNVTMSKAFTDNYPDAKFGTGADGISAPNLTVLNIPTYTHILEMEKELSPYNERVDYPSFGMTATPTEWTLTTYVAENKVRGTDDKAKAEATYFILQLPYQLNAGGEVVTDNYYKFYINDYRNNPDPHMTRGGRLYNVSVTVNGFGGALPDINGAQVKTTVLPWGGETSQTDPVGEYLKVPSAVEIEYGEDCKLDIQASHAVTVTKTNPKITMTQVDKVITLRSDDMDTKVKTPSYDKITVKMGSLTKEIQVNYRPHPGYLMAKRNLSADAQTIKEAPNEYSYGAHFMYGSVIATKSFDHITIGDLYDATDVLWAPKDVASPSSWDGIPMQAGVQIVDHNQASINAGKGDPCRLLGLTKEAIKAGTIDNNKWRLPTVKELQKINSSHFTRPAIESVAGYRYWYSDTFKLYLPLAGCRDAVTGALLLAHEWGLWQANSMSSNPDLPPNDYATLTSNVLVKPKVSLSPMFKGHSVRCIQQ